MYCIVIFAEANTPDNESLKSGSKTKKLSIRSRGSISSGGSVKSNEKYGENKTVYINPNCRVQILIDYLYDVTGLEKKQSFDLCDVNGVLMNLRVLKEWEYATKVLDHQQTYYIILCDPGEGGKLRIEPLLQKSSKTNTELLVLLKKRLGSSVTITSNKDKSPRRKSSDMSRNYSSSKRRSPKTKRVKMSKSVM